MCGVCSVMSRKSTTHLNATEPVQMHDPRSDFFSRVAPRHRLRYTTGMSDNYDGIWAIAALPLFVLAIALLAVIIRLVGSLFGVKSEDW